MHIIETPLFTRRVQKEMPEEDYRRLQVALLSNPALGVDLGGGLFKLRWGAGQRGKRGGFRVVYYWVCPQATVLMLFLFAKNEQDNLSAEQESALRKLVREEYP